MGRLLGYGLANLFTLILVLICLVTSLLATEAGTRWLLPRLLSLSPQPITLVYASGTLWQALRLQQVQVIYPGIRVEVQDVQIDWQLVWQRVPIFSLTQVQAQQVRIYLPAQAAPGSPSALNASSATFAGLPKLPRLPVTVEIKNLPVENFLIQRGDQIYPPMSAKLTASWQQQLLAELELSWLPSHLAEWDKRFADLSANLHAQVELDQQAFKVTVLPSRINGLWQQQPLNIELSASLQTDAQSQLRVQAQLADNKINLQGELAAVSAWRDPLAWLDTPVQFSGQLQLPKLAALSPELSGGSELSGWSELSGELQADVQLTGSIRDPNLKLQAQTAQLKYKQWQAQQVKANLHLQARLPWPANSRDDWQISLLPSQLNGQWRGQPVQMQISAQVDAKQPSQFYLQAQLANNRLEMTLVQPFALRWKLTAPRLTQVWPQWPAQVFSQGIISGSLRDPLVDAQFRVQSLQYQQFHWANLQAQIEGRLMQHELKISGRDAQGQLALQAKGGVNAASGAVKYRLLSSSLTLPELGGWRQQQASDWAYEPKTGPRIGKTCWQQNNASACGELQIANAVLKADVSVADLPLKLVQPLLPKTLTVTGQVSGRAQYLYQDQHWQGDGQLQLGAGSVHYLLPSTSLTPSVNVAANNAAANSVNTFTPTVYAWQQAQLSWQQQGKQWQAKLFWDYLPYGQVRADLQQAADQQLSGNVQVQFDQLQLLEPWLAGVQDVRGKLQLNSQISGRWPQPLLVGQLRLTEGSLRVPAQNLLVQPITATADFAADKTFSLRGQAQSGAGALQLLGQGFWSSGVPRWKEASAPWQLQLRLQGEDVLLSDTPTVKLHAQPDLLLTLAPQKMDWRGSLGIPRATVKLKEWPAEVVRVSSDVRLFQNNQLMDTDARWQQFLSTDVQVALGSAVTFQGLGLQADVTGNLHVVSTPGKPLQAFGEIAIPKGSYQKYGQNLEMQQGSLRFQGAADNPAVNIEALRHTEFADVTLALSGTLKTPASKVYSSPPLPESEAMALLVTGKPLSSASSEDNNRVANAAFSLGVNRSQSLINRVAKTVGVDTLTVDPGDGINDSALLIGKYLNPNLYVSYIHGLFAQTSSIGMDYKLTPNITINAKSGAESSLDVLYRFERE